MNKLVRTLYFSAALWASNTLWAADGPSVEPISTAKTRFQHVQVEQQDGRYVVSGKIKRSTYNSQVAPGHIDYIVLDSTGDTVAEGAVSYSPSLSLRRWKYGSSFSVLLPNSVKKDAKVKLTYHRDQSGRARYSPPAIHQANVLINQ